MRFPHNFWALIGWAAYLIIFVTVVTATDEVNTVPAEKGKPASALDIPEPKKTTSVPKQAAKPGKPPPKPAKKPTTIPPITKRPPMPPSPVRDKCTCGLKPAGDDDTGTRPWHCEVNIATKNGSIICSGTLIDSQWILTSASCAMHAPKLDHKTGVRVTCGDRSSSKSAKKNSDVKVDRVSIHDEYIPSKTQVHNLALLHLMRALDLEDGTLPACLPFKDNALGCVSKIGITVSTTFMGFKNGGQTFDTQEMACLPSTECKVVMKKDFKVTNDMLCSQKNDMTCPDKSGNAGSGILYHSAKDEIPRSYLIGVNVFGPNCLEAETPGINMYVYRYLDWISEETMGAQLCDEAIVFDR